MNCAGAATVLRFGMGGAASVAGKCHPGATTRSLDRFLDRNRTRTAQETYRRASEPWTAARPGRSTQPSGIRLIDNLMAGSAPYSIQWMLGGEAHFSWAWGRGFIVSFCLPEGDTLSSTGRHNWGSGSGARSLHSVFLSKFARWWSNPHPAARSPNHQS